MNFVGIDQFYLDITAWERLLPQFDAVCGVPRSGLIPAAYIALRRNIRLVELTDLLRQPEGAIERAPIRETNPIIKFNRRCGNRLLIVDDSSSEQSVTFTGLREKLANQTTLDISYGSVYRAAPNSKVDYYFREVPLPRMFGWNWYRHWWLSFTILDIDGVLCEDWQGPPEKDHDDLFRDHLKNVRPLYLPHVPVKAIVTSRLERYRNETEEWLRRHGVHYQQLVMHPAKTPEERRSMNDHASRKAAVYAQNKDAVLFVESDIRQARKIHQLTSRPVLCIDTMEMLSQKCEDLT
jgi:uncharacterized HAD superfamily protein